LSVSHSDFPVGSTQGTLLCSLCAIAQQVRLELIAQHFKRPLITIFIFDRLFMNIHLSLMPVLALVAGLCILVKPKLVSFIVALYLIIVGLVGILGLGRFHLF